MKRLLQPLYRYLQLATLGLLCLSCSNHTRTHNRKQSNYVIAYAKGFTVNKQQDYIEVSIRNPWDTTSLLENYLLIHRGDPVPKNLPLGTIIYTPVQKVVAYESLHCSLLSELDELATLIGVCEPQYILMPSVRQLVANGSIADLGQSGAPNIEKIIDLAPDVIMTSPYQHVNYGRVGKLGIPLIECADYMEATPLGRAEWIRFHSLFFEKEAWGDSLFAQTVTHYQTLKEKVAQTKTRPTLFSERKTGPTWYVPGGNSYMAQLYKDAGARYIWQDNGDTGSIPLSGESVFEEASHADFWLIKYNAAQPLTYEQLGQEYHLYAQFDAFQKHQIFGCNGAVAPLFEEMPLHPDRLLEDLIAILHPELLPDYQKRYFEPLAK